MATLYINGDQTTNDTTNCGYSTNYFQCGQTAWSPNGTDTVKINEIKVRLSKVGTITSIDWKLEIWDSAPGGTLLGTSATVTGGDWSNTLVSFTFSPSVSVTYSKTYSFVWRRTDSNVSTTNWLTPRLGVSNIITGNWMAWTNGDVEYSSNPPVDIAMDIWIDDSSWNHKIMGKSPAKVMGIEKARIAKIMGV
jgi:hypothetical protein